MHKKLIIAALAAVVAGCSSTDSVSPTVSLTGSYSLRSINGQNLPVQVSDGRVLTSDVLSLNDDGTFSDDAQFSDGTVSIEQGFFSASNGAIQFQDAQTGQTFSGSLSGSVLTEFFPNGPTEVYQKM
ncbi:MAG TPA: hypothetical protein VN706_13010 [Gemmatimonadaceae bacterium]|nr:hypothetical protein [Gemmatimonadaceae bacterium]